MRPEDKIEKQFENLIEFLRYSTKIVRKIFTPDAFNYHFLYREYTAHQLFEHYHIRKYWKTEKLSSFVDTITQEDIKNRRFELPDGIYPITRITEKLNLRSYMRSRDKKNLGPEEAFLEIVSGPEELNRIKIVYDKGDKIFIKNWEKVFGDDVSVLRSDTLFFLIVKNGTLEIRTFSLNNENKNNKTLREMFKDENDRVKFGIDTLIPSKTLIPDLIPFGEKPVIWQYRLSRLFFDLIINFLWNKDENDKNKILTGIKNLVDNLWTDEMFKARREFLYFSSIEEYLKEKENLLKALEEKKALLDEMRKNPNKYLPKLTQNTEKISFYEILEKSKANLPPSVYLITQYRIGEIVLRNPMNRTIIIDNIPDYWDDIGKNIIEQELHAELFYKSGFRWKIGFIYSWPTSNSSDAYLTFFYIHLPFNPYIQYSFIYIPDEIANFLLDNILKFEPSIQRWIEKKATEDKEKLYKSLEDLLNELRMGNLSNYTIWEFDKAGEEDKDKRQRLESWKKEWEKSEKESQASESKKEEKKERKREGGPVIEVYSGLGQTKHTEHIEQAKQEEQVLEISEIKEDEQIKQEEEKEQKFVEELRQEVEIHEEEEQKQEQKEEKIFKAPELQIEEPKVEEKQEAKIDREQKETTKKPKRGKKKEEISEVQQKEQKETTEKPKRKKKEEKISEQQQEQEKKEEKVEEEKVEEIKKQDIMEELEDADIEAKVKSKVQVKLPKDMLEELVDEKPQKRKTTKRKKTKKSKKKKDK
jgi:hypothetical protein